MSTWYALRYPIKPGSEDAVKEIFRTSGRPRFEVTDADGKVVGRLLSTLAFVGVETAVRVIEIDGPLPLVAAHMSRQPEVKDFERQLEQYLTEPRDMLSPDGARAFFQRAGMENVLNRRAPEATRS